MPSGEAYWELFSTSYGPTKTLADSLGERREEFHGTWVDFFEANYHEDGEIAHAREYLLVLGTRPEVPLATSGASTGAGPSAPARPSAPPGSSTSHSP
jgi:hypothetical protein